MSASDPDPNKPIHLVERHLRSLAQRGRRTTSQTTTVTSMSKADRSTLDLSFADVRALRDTIANANEGEVDGDSENVYDSELEMEASDVDSDSEDESSGGTSHVMQAGVPSVAGITSYSMTQKKVPKTGRRGVDSLIASQSSLEPLSKRRRITRGISYAPNHPNDPDLFGPDFDSVLHDLYVIKQETD